MESLTLTPALAIQSCQVLATSRLCANLALAGDWKSAYTYALETVAVRNDIETSLLFFDFVRYYEIEALLRGGDREWAREDIQRFGASLSTNRRHRLPEMTYEEMAEVLTIPVGTIKTHLSRARNLLKERLLAQHICGSESRGLS